MAWMTFFVIFGRAQLISAHGLFSICSCLLWIGGTSVSINELADGKKLRPNSRDELHDELSHISDHIHSDLERGLNRSLAYPSRHQWGPALFDVAKFSSPRYVPLHTEVADNAAALLQLHDHSVEPVHKRPYQYVGNLETYQRLVDHHTAIQTSKSETSVNTDSKIDESGTWILGDKAPKVEQDKTSFVQLYDSLGSFFQGIKNTFLQKSVSKTSVNFRDSHYVAPLSDKRDHTSQHLGTIEVGRQRQRISVIFDSGSTNLWIGSDLCTNPICSANKDTLYAHSKSGNEADLLCKEGDVDCDDLRIEFGSGTLEGPLAKDTVYLAGHEIKNMPFAMIRSERGDVFSTLKYGGILGLAFEDMASPKLKGIMTKAIENDVFHGTNILAFYFTKNPNVRSGVHFGGVNSKLFENTPHCFDVTKEHYWQTGLRRMGFKWGLEAEYVDWVPDTNAGRAPTSIFWDTGTTWNAGPTYLTNYIQRTLARRGFSEPDCESLRVKTGKEIVPYLVLEMCIDYECTEIYTVSQPPEQWFVGAGGNYCRPGFMSIDVPPPWGPAVFITGEIFMRTFYTIFERNSQTRSRVCIAKNKSQERLEHEGALAYAKELSDDKIVNRVILTRHRNQEPYGANADVDG